MTPAARAAAAIGVLDRILGGMAAEQALLAWARSSRYAGSGDRAAVRDWVFDSLRRRRSRAALGGADTGRGLVLGALREAGADPDTVFGAGPHAPDPLTGAERAAGRPPSPDEATDLPGWLLPDLRAALGGDFDAIAAALRERAPVWLRVNALRASPAEAIAVLAGDGIAAEPSPLLPHALRVTAGARRLAASRAYAEGLVELQDLSPQLAVAALGDLRGKRVLDLCAGGGGKALALAALGAQVQAHDVDAARMADLPARAARARARVAIGPPQGRYDLVVADVPCSGSGTWRRDPAGKWRLTPERLQALIEAQAAILEQAATLVRPGGHVAYMTCALLRAENEGRIAAAPPPLTPCHMHRFDPLRASDGFFLAVLDRGRR